MFKPIVLLAALSLNGCAGLSLTTLARAAAFPAAAGAETRVGANCIRARERGETPSAVPIFDIQNARDVYDATFGPLQPPASNDALGRIRTRVNANCPAVPQAPAAVLETPQPATPAP